MHVEDAGASTAGARLTSLLRRDVCIATRTMIDTPATAIEASIRRCDLKMLAATSAMTTAEAGSSTRSASNSLPYRAHHAGACSRVNVRARRGLTRWRSRVGEPHENALKALQAGEAFGKEPTPRGGDAIGTPSAFLDCPRFDEARFFEPGDGSVQSTRPEPRPGMRFDVFNDCVPVLRTGAKRRQDQQGGVDITHHVIYRTT